MKKLYPKYTQADETHQVVIIGAGIAGLTAANHLVQAGIDVLVLEQDEHTGGRCRTWTSGDAVFDIGAQFFTVRSETFRTMADAWLDSGAALEWARVFPDTSGVSEREGHPRYRGAKGMRSLAEALLDNTNVRTDAPVKRIEESKASWIIQVEDQPPVQGDILVLTPPAPVSLRLISDENTWRMGALLLPMSGIEYRTMIAVAAFLDGPAGLPAPGAMRVDDDTVAWIADNQAKGISPGAPAVTLHGAKRFCEHHWNLPPEESGAMLIQAAAPFLKGDILNYQTFVWQYAVPTNTQLGDFYLVDGRAPLYFAGDVFAGGLIEGAAVSGAAVAADIRGRLKS